MNSQPPIKFVKAEGSPITGQFKSKRERIQEAMYDLQIAINGFKELSINSEQLDQILFRNSIGAFSRASSIFLRKMIIEESNLRLLDSEICKSLELKFHKLNKIPLSNRKKLDIVKSIDGGALRLSKLDEQTLLPDAIYNLPINPFKLTISIEWPLPGSASWTENPVLNNPWQVRAEELFDTNSSPQLDCDQWLGQQLIMFDNKGISLKEAIRIVANTEGAHSTSVGPFNADRKRKIFQTSTEH